MQNTIIVGKHKRLASGNDADVVITASQPEAVSFLQVGGGLIRATLPSFFNALVFALATRTPKNPSHRVS